MNSGDMYTQTQNNWKTTQTYKYQGKKWEDIQKEWTKKEENIKKNKKEETKKTKKSTKEPTTIEKINTIEKEKQITNILKEHNLRNDIQEIITLQNNITKVNEQTEIQKKTEEKQKLEKENKGLATEINTLKQEIKLLESRKETETNDLNLNKIKGIITEKKEEIKKKKEQLKKNNKTIDKIEEALEEFNDINKKEKKLSDKIEQKITNIIWKMGKVITEYQSRDTALFNPKENIKLDTEHKFLLETFNSLRNLSLLWTKNFPNPQGYYRDTDDTIKNTNDTNNHIHYTLSSTGRLIKNNWDKKSIVNFEENKQKTT